jgi:iron only hydrogenase large subunit-like protein/uncharacterized Fe-S cluster-containing protein
LKAIRFSGGHARIIAEDCIWCGLCYAACPQTTKEIFSERYAVEGFLKAGNKVVASLAPSFAAQYGGATIADVETALKKLGFAMAEETVVGATKVCEAYNALLDEGRDIVISSSCPSVNLMIQKYFPDAIDYLAPVLSPMQTHALDIKTRIPDAKVVFIGPCVAKKDEAEHYEDVDAVLTFEQLSRWLEQENIVPAPSDADDGECIARLFPTTGGILKTMAEKLPDYTYVAIDGVENCAHAIQDILDGKIHRCFIEMSACAGGCIGGPVMEKFHASPLKDFLAVSRYAGEKDITVYQPTEPELRKVLEFIPHKLPMPSENEITAILRQMGKMKPADELNCGSCGYDTCRMKAIAIFQGKADVSMCLPYLKDRAETFSDNIVNHTPNGILVVNEKLEVQQINDAARRILHLRSPRDILGDQVIRILDPKPFLKALESGRGLPEERVYLAEYDRYVEQSIVTDKDNHLLICMMRDVTDEELARKRKEDISSQTVAIADKVVEKQMRIVQEIASLLGETAAETKIALTKLKESIQDE